MFNWAGDEEDRVLRGAAKTAGLWRVKSQNFSLQLKYPKDELKQLNYEKVNLLNLKLSKVLKERSSEELLHPDSQNPKDLLARHLSEQVNAQKAGAALTSDSEGSRCKSCSQAHDCKYDYSYGRIQGPCNQQSRAQYLHKRIKGMLDPKKEKTEAYTSAEARSHHKKISPL